MRAVFKRHRGSMTLAARELRVSLSTLSLYLDGQVNSSRLDLSVPVIVKKLLDSEGIK